MSDLVVDGKGCSDSTCVSVSSRRVRMGPVSAGRHAEPAARPRWGRRRRGGRAARDRDEHRSVDQSQLRLL